VIAVDQDPLGVQGFRHSTDGELELWFKPLEGGDWAMCALNRGTSPRRIEIVWQDETWRTSSRTALQGEVSTGPRPVAPTSARPAGPKSGSPWPRRAHGAAGSSAGREQRLIGRIGRTACAGQRR
jgi:hypothetical protein